MSFLCFRRSLLAATLQAVRVWAAPDFTEVPVEAPGAATAGLSWVDFDADGAVVIESSSDLAAWWPIHTNSLAASATIEVPISPDRLEFFRLRLAGE